jgi:hypothetical protein
MEVFPKPGWFWKTSCGFSPNGLRNTLFLAVYCALRIKPSKIACKAIFLPGKLPKQPVYREFYVFFHRKKT